MLLSIPAVVLGSPQDRIGNDPPVKLDLVFHPGSKESHTISTAVDGDMVHSNTGQGRTAIPLTIVFNPGKKEAATQVILQDTGRHPGGLAVHDTPVKDQAWKAFWEEPVSKGREVTWGNAKKRFSLFSGYRRDDLFWNIYFPLATSTDPPESVFIASELTWSNVEIFEIGGRLTFEPVSRLVFGLDMVYGFIMDGIVQDSDYIGNGPDRSSMTEFSRSYGKTDTGSTYDLSADLGYVFKFSSSSNQSVFLKPLVGLGINSQNYKFTNGLQSIPVQEDITGLNSRYDADWIGPFAGMELGLDFLDKYRLIAGFQYHHLDYEASADWNLREDFAHPVSFRHKADGDGFTLYVNQYYKPFENWSFDLGFTWRKFTADDGTGITYFSDGTSGTVHFNEVEWKSWSLNLGSTYYF